MKKKIALLLALIMTISLMPVTIFAASDNRISRYDYNVASQSLYVLQKDSFKGATIADANSDAAHKAYSQWVSDRKTVRTSDAYVYQAPMLQLELSSSRDLGYAERDSFNLKLENAVWTAWVIDTYDGGGTSGRYTSDNPVFANTNKYSTVSSAAAGGASAVEASFSSEDWYTITYDAKGTTTVTNDYGTLGYTLTISRIDPSVATINILGEWDPTANNGNGGYVNYKKDATLYIPILMTVTSESSDVTVTMTSNNSPFTSDSFLVVSSRGSGTKTTVKSTKTGTDRIALDTIIITENRPGVIGNGVFEITAPSGYEFNDPSNWIFRTDLGLTHNSVSLGEKIPVDKTNGPVRYIDSTKSSKFSRESYYIYISGFGSSRTRAGILTIDNVILIPIDDNPQTDRNLEIRIESSNTVRDSARIAYANTGLASIGFTTENIVVAKSVNYSIEFYAASSTPQLVAGAWDYSGEDVETSIHAAARVTFKELEVGAWRSERPTTFTLPEGVQIRRIKYNTTSNIETILSTVTIFNKEMPTSDVEVSRFINNDSVVTYYGNSFTLRDIIKDRSSNNMEKLATLEFTLYLSISPDFEGPVTLEVSGGGVPADINLEPVTIATAIKPIEIITETKLVDIGYQTYEVNDITIKENIKGALKRNENLNLALIDKTGTRDLRFSTITNDQIERISGNIAVSSLKYTNGIIGLTIDRESTEPSSFKIKDLVVRITRDVPYGSYDLVVYGNAVYNNYSYVHNFAGTYITSSDRGGNVVNKINTLTGFENYGFIRENYIQVGTYGATDVVKPAPSANSKIFIYPGSTTVYIDGEAKVVDPAPINDNGTIYIPLRFFSEALGMVVAWDAGTATGTIKSNNKTFVVTSGNSVMFVDGVPVTMTDIGGSPVTPKIVNDKILIPIRAFFNGAVGLNQDAIQWKDFYAEIN